MPGNSFQVFSESERFLLSILSKSFFVNKCFFLTRRYNILQSKAGLGSGCSPRAANPLGML